MNIPSRITAGESLSWIDLATTSAAGLPINSAAGWTLAYTFRGQVAAGNATVNGIAKDGGWQTSLTSAQTTAFSDAAADKVVWWAAWATLGDQRVKLGDGQLVVLLDLNAVPTGNAYDGRSDAEKTLAAINAEISRRVKGGAVVEYSIGSRQLKRETMQSLQELRSRYLLIVRNEKRRQQSANRQGATNQIGVRFTGSAR